MSELQLRGIKKSFGAVHVIPNFDLDIKDGDFVVFVGPSGCGKSTLLRIIAGLEDLSGGTIVIDSEDVTLHDPADRGVAMVFQSYALYPHMTVEKNLGFGLRMGGMPKSEVDERVNAVANILELSPLMERKPRALSGGQKQRVAIGRAIVRDPKIFLFDEPLSNLDAELRVQMRVEIANLHKKLGTTMIYVTHDQVEAMTLADKIVVLRAGRIEQQGCPIDIYDDPDTLFVAGFIGSPKMNLIEATIIEALGNQVTVRTQGFPETPVTVSTRTSRAKTGDKVTFGVRPEHIVPVQIAKVVFTAQAQVVEQLGGVSYIYATGVDGTKISIEEKGHSHVPVGTEMKIGINPEVCFLFYAYGLRL